MLKKLIIKLVGKKLRDKWQLEDAEKVPKPGETIISVPWYRSKSKIGFIIFMIATALEYGPPAFGKEPVKIPPEALDLLESLGLGIGAYGLRDAIKSPAKQLYEHPPVAAGVEK